MKNFFSKLLKNVSAFFGTSQAHDIERAIVTASAPVVEAALIGVSKENPIAAVVVTTVVLPAVETEVSHIEQTKNQASS